MRQGRVVRAVVVVLAIAGAHRYVRADCASGASEGYDQCAKRPSCLCSYEVVACDGGGWYTRYFLDKACAASPTGAGAGSGSGSGSGSKPPHVPKAPKKQCEMMNKWLSEERKFLQGYEDPDLVNIAASQGWSSGQYNALIDRAVHPTVYDPKAGGAVMETDPVTCQIKNVDKGCQWLLSHGLPKSACDIAKAHEEVHAAQCRASKNDPSYDPTDLYRYQQREIEAHKHTIADIEQWIGDHC